MPVSSITLETPASPRPPSPGPRHCAKDRRSARPAAIRDRFSPSLLKHAVAAAERAPFNPTSFVFSAIEAVAPLVDVAADKLKSGKTRVDVVRALIPIFGRYTVADAVMAFGLIKIAQRAEVDEDVPSGNTGLPLYEAREALEAFASTARATSPACVSARALLAKYACDDGCVLSDANAVAIQEMHRTDISDLRAGKFYGEAFDDPDWLTCHAVFAKSARTERVE